MSVRARGGRVVAVAGALAVALVAATTARAEDSAPLPSLQALVDATPERGLLRPPPGRYAGPVRLTRPITIDGRDAVTVDGGGKATVIRIEGSGIAIRRLHITGSGTSHDGVDAGVAIQGNGNVVENNVIDDCLFGIDLAQSNENVLRANRISSKQAHLGVRGDAVRLWYSFRNQVIENELSDVRDMVIWYSSHNLVARNRVLRSRYALHTMYAHENHVEDNEFRGNMTGVFLMYSDGVQLRRNRILGAQGAAGIGIGFKESSRILLEDNDIVYCATGIQLDVSPYEPDTINRFDRNRLAYNGIGVVFHNDWTGNEFRDNEFIGNFTQVAVHGRGGATRNLFENNYWDDYEGFDRDGDGRGDTPYELRAYADRIWMGTPAATFFRGSPLLEVIDFLDRLAPFSEPTRILRDERPRFERSAPQADPERAS